MKRLDAAMAFLALNLAAWPAWGQRQDMAAAPAADAALGGQRPGARLYSVSVFGDYYSNGQAANFSTAAGVRSDIAYGGSVSMGWIKTGSRLSATVMYTPSYTGRMRYSNLHSFGHNLSANFGVQLSPKWTVDLGVTGMIANLQRILFGSSQTGQLASTPSTFADLSSAMLSGQYSSPQLIPIVAAPQVANSPASPILYGTRYLTVATVIDVNYNRSERFHISAGATGARSQSLAQNSGIGTGVPVSALPRYTTGGGHVSVFYGLTPRLTFNGSWNGYRIFGSQVSTARYGNRLIHNVTGTLGYIAGTKWVFTVGGGLGYLPHAVPVGTANQVSSGIRYIGNGSVAYKFFSQTLVATAARTVGNAYGLGGSTMLTANLGWHWNRPGSAWGVSADGGYQNLGSPAGASSPLTGWRGTASLHRMLSRRLSCGADYTFLRNTGVYTLVNYTLSRSAAQVILTYSFADQLGPDQ